jgi:hypothetical protein
MYYCVLSYYKFFCFWWKKENKAATYCLKPASYDYQSLIICSKTT